MYCKKCGFKIPDGKSVCPFCGTDSNETIVNEESNSQNYQPINENEMSEFRNQFGFINLNTQFWHHILIAAGGYLLMYFFAYIVMFIAIRIAATHYDFSCSQNGLSSCPIEIQNVYTKISSTGQVVAELLVVAILLIIFRKHLKNFFMELKDKVTWKWYGVGLAIMYGGNMIYNMLITFLGLSSTSSNQNAVNEVIFGAPLLGFFFVVLAAPLFEEIIFRFGVFRTFTFKNKKFEKLGVILTTILFASVHMIATFQEVANGPVCMVEMSGTVYVEENDTIKEIVIKNDVNHTIIVYDENMVELKKVEVLANTNNFNNGYSISIQNYTYNRNDILYLTIDGQKISNVVNIDNSSQLPYYYNFSAYDVLSSDLLTLPVYLIGAFALTFAYYKSKNLATSMAMHMTYNGLSFLLILMM